MNSPFQWTTPMKPLSRFKKIAATLALVAPTGRALWELPTSGVGAIRVLYGVPGGREMEAELQAWIYSISGISQAAQDKWWSDFKSSPSIFTGSTIRNTNPMPPVSQLLRCLMAWAGA